MSHPGRSGRFSRVVVVAIGLAWAGYIFLFIRQQHLREIADPMSDTGVSLGSVFLTAIVGPLLLGVTALGMISIMIRAKIRQRRMRYPGEREKRTGDLHPSAWSFSIKLLSRGQIRA